jgi:F0F1-type ATP synthase membrane subunit b/b'
MSEEPREGWMPVIDKELKQLLLTEIHPDQLKELKKKLDKAKCDLADAVMAGNDPAAMLNKDIIKGAEAETQKLKETPSETEALELGEIVDTIISKVSTNIAQGLNADGGNKALRQIMPLMSKTLAHALKELIGERNAQVLTSSSHLRGAFMFTMVVAFLLHKFLVDSNVKLVAITEQLSDEAMQEMADSAKHTQQRIIQEVESHLRDIFKFIEDGQEKE